MYFADVATFFYQFAVGHSIVFLNDFLSQENGFSVPDATIMVVILLLGIECAKAIFAEATYTRTI